MAEQGDGAKPADKPVNGAATSDIIQKLRKAVIAHGEEVNELRFREPTAGDIEKCGNPVNIEFNEDGKPKMTFNERSMSAMMSALATVPPSTIKQMHPRDWNTAAWNCGFFHAGLVSEVVLDCYRLAKYYGRSPAEFLNMPVSEVNRHMHWTAKLIEITRSADEEG